MRDYLKEKTFIRFPGGECYEILGMIGEGGSGLIYSAGKVVRQGEDYVKENSLRFALKECYPISRQFNFLRMQSGEIVPENESEAAANYLRCVASMQLNEGQMTSEIYDSEAIRLIPIQRIASSVEISFDKGQHFQYVNNAFTVMASMENKGESIASWYQKDNRYTVEMIFRVIQETLFAVREVHLAGYLHLDLQEGNIFVTGQPTDESLTCFLLDFGSARKRLADGLCAPVGDQPIFSSEGYRAPEIVGIMTGEMPDFRLGPEADLYSIGYLLLYLLTGRRYSTRMLEDVRKSYDGHYLTRKNIQDMKCPPHAEEIIQRILAKALETDPEKRYHTAEEMLKDVSAALNALRPYHSQIAGLKYDAYILYRSDNILHKHVALSLQKLLERFRTPGLKRIQRVFLDETELSADYQADKQVMDALKASRYLIIIGQDASGDDIWQSKEVKFFLKTHKPSEVLTILAAQKPGTSEKVKASEREGLSGASEAAKALEVPETASTAEVPEHTVVKVGGRDRNFPLAADIRGASEKEILKKLKKDGFLRIAAPILSVPYDGLVQRYRKYKRRKRLTTAAVCLSAAAFFTVYALYQSYQITLQETIARRNKAQNLCVQAMDQYDSGDKAAAVASALQISEEAGETENYIAPEQVYTLNTVLDSYESGQWIYFSPLQKITSDFSRAAFSKDSGYYGYAIDQEGRLEVVSVDTTKENDSVWWTLDASDIQLEEKELADDRSGITFAAALDDHRAIILTGEKENYAAVIDAADRKVVSGFYLEVPMVYGKRTYDCKENMFVYRASDFNIYVYDAAKGQQLACISSEMSDGECHFSDVKISHDGKKIAAGSDQGLMIYDIENKQQRTTDMPPVEKVTWIDDTHVACEQYQIVQDAMDSSDVWMRQKRQYAFSIYDVQGQKVLNTNEANFGYDTDTIGMQMIYPEKSGEKVPEILGWLRSDLYFIDRETGNIEDMISFQSDIVSVQRCSDNDSFVFAGLSDGTIVKVSAGETISKYQAYKVDSELYDFSYVKGKKMLLFTEEGIVSCDLSEDSEMNQYVYESNQRICNIEKIQTLSGTAYRCVWTSDKNRNEYIWSKHGFNLYSLDSEDVLMQYTCGEGKEIHSIQIAENEGKSYVCVLELSNAYGDDIPGGLKVLSMQDGTEIACYDLPAQADMGENTFRWQQIQKLVLLKNLTNAIVLDEDGQVYRENFKNGTTELLNAAQNGCSKILDISMDKTGTALRLLGIKDGYLELFKYDIENNCVLASEIWQSTEEANGGNAFMTESCDGSMIVVYDGDKQCTLIRTDHWGRQKEVDIDNAKNFQICFFDENRFLLGVDSQKVWLYDLEKERVVSSYSINDIKGYHLKLSADQHGGYFTLKEDGLYENLQTDEGLRREQSHIYFVDDSHQIYPYADVAYGYKLPDEDMVYQNYLTGYAGHSLYTFSDLYKKAQ